MNGYDLVRRWRQNTGSLLWHFRFYCRATRERATATEQQLNLISCPGKARSHQQAPQLKVNPTRGLLCQKLTHTHRTCAAAKHRGSTKSKRFYQKVQNPERLTTYSGLCSHWLCCWPPWARFWQKMYDRGTLRPLMGHGAWKPVFPLHKVLRSSTFIGILVLEVLSHCNLRPSLLSSWPS